MSKAKSFFTDKRTIISIASALIIAAMLFMVVYDPFYFSAESLYNQLTNTAVTPEGYDFSNKDKTESTPIVDDTPDDKNDGGNTSTDDGKENTDNKSDGDNSETDNSDDENNGADTNGNNGAIGNDNDADDDNQTSGGAASDGEGSGDEESNTPPTDTSDEEPEEVLDDDKNFAFVSGNLIQFAVLRSSKLSNDSEEKKIVDRLVNEIKAKYDGLLIKSDQFESEPDAKEIIVGRTTRTESVDALNEIKNNRKNNAADYIIRVVGNKIVINAVDDDALADAVDYFIENAINSGINKISKSFKRIYRPAVQNIVIAGKGILDYTIVTQRDSSYFYTRHIDELCDFVRISTGVRISVVDATATEKTNEILVGNTGRSGTPTAPSGNKYTVKQSGNKVYLVGNHINTLDGAVRHLLGVLKEKMSISAGYNVTNNYSAASGDYKLVWNDEFTGNTLDTSVWSKRTFRRSTTQFGTYTLVKPENVSVKDGNLIITGKKDADKVYSSGEVHTGDTLEYVYGYIEIRAKMAVGTGVWTNFWLQNRKGNKAFLEIDIFEKFPYTDTTLYSNLHTWWWDKDIEGSDVSGHWYIPNTEKHNGYYLTGGETFGDAYHTYSCEWTKDVISFFVDGKKTYEYPIGLKEDEIFHTPVSVVLDMYLGEYGVQMNESVLTNPQKPCNYYIDYIHLYQKPGSLLNFDRK